MGPVKIRLTCTLPPQKAVQAEMRRVSLAQSNEVFGGNQFEQKFYDRHSDFFYGWVGFKDTVELEFDLRNRSITVVS